jgi:NAD(P)H-flavin reductase
MLAMKSQYAPLTLIFRSSHEQLNAWHRISGRVIYVLLLSHASWYMNYFIQNGLVQKRLTEFIVIVGITAFLGITVLFSSALEAVRHRSYRVFFVLHFLLGLWVLPLLFFHVKELRLYIAETLILFIFDLVYRKVDTFTGNATITKVPGTKIVKMKIPVPPAKLSRFAAAPGQHVYLFVPPESRPSNAGTPSIHDFLFNPFTVAEVSSTDVTLVMRTCNGPSTRAIEILANLTKARPPIDVEGPYGMAKRFPGLVDNYDRILLVAGGVGATFILPIYRHLRDEMESESISPDRLKLIWSMRYGAEASWAFDTPAEPSLEDDEHVNIYLTRSTTDTRERNQTADGSVELDDLQQVGRPIKATGGRSRPDLRKIVDEVFRLGPEERIAVLVCGPENMAKELRKYVGSWVNRGRDVWWHDETLYANVSFLITTLT